MHQVIINHKLKTIGWYASDVPVAENHVAIEYETWVVCNHQNEATVLVRFMEMMLNYKYWGKASPAKRFESVVFS